MSVSVGVCACVVCLCVHVFSFIQTHNTYVSARQSASTYVLMYSTAAHLVRIKAGNQL